MNYKLYYIYIMVSNNKSTIYTGVTNNLIRRTYEHRNHLVKGFTDKYNCVNLVYYEITNDSYGAITREKQIKQMSRLKKEQLINAFNPNWQDLYESICQ